MARPLPPHDLLDDPVAALDYPDQHQKVERQGADIRPHRRDGAAPCIDRRRTGRERRKNDAGQRNDQTLQADPRIAPQEPFCPPERTAGTVRVAVPASAGAPWAGRRLCDRCPCFGSLFPPQAAVASAAVRVPVCTNSTSRTIATKKQPYAFRKAAPTSGPADRRIPRGLSRALKRLRRSLFAGRDAGRPARAVLVPDGAPLVRSIPGCRNKR